MPTSERRVWNTPQPQTIKSAIITNKQLPQQHDMACEESIVLKEILNQKVLTKKKIKSNEPSS